MHSYFSNEAQPYCNSDYFITVAEVASTVNEVLLTKYLLATETDPRRRAYVLNHFLEGFRTTVFRQTLFAEFERQAHDLDQAGTPLTAEGLNKIYHDLNALYYTARSSTPCRMSNGRGSPTSTGLSTSTSTRPASARPSRLPTISSKPATLPTT